MKPPRERRLGYVGIHGHGSRRRHVTIPKISKEKYEKSTNISERLENLRGSENDMRFSCVCKLLKPYLMLLLESVITSYDSGCRLTKLWWSLLL